MPTTVKDWTLAEVGNFCVAYTEQKLNEQIKQMTQRMNELKLAKETLKTKELDLRGQEVDRDAFKGKIENALRNLEKA